MLLETFGTASFPHQDGVFWDIYYANVKELCVPFSLQEGSLLHFLAKGPRLQLIFAQLDDWKQFLLALKCHVSMIM